MTQHKDRVEERSFVKLALSMVGFWFKRKWSKAMTKTGEPSLDDFYSFVKRGRDL